MISYVSDWTARLKSRLYTQFRSAVTWNQWAEMLGAQSQDIEDAAQSLITIADIDDSEGAQLDMIGRIVGQPRAGVSDEIYKPYLRARILANKSSGAAEDIYKVFRAVYGDSIGLVITTSIVGAKTFALRIKGLITDSLSGAGVTFLRASKEAGARGVMEWQTAPDLDMFTFMTGSTLSSSASAGATSITVRDTSAFVGAGQLLIDAGLASGEVVASFSVTSGTTLSVPALANSHSANASVELVSGPGKGFGTASSTTTGGVFARASQA